MVKNDTSSLVEIMDEKEIQKEFLKELRIETKNLFNIIEEIKKDGDMPDKEIVFLLQKEVEKVETFLDDYGATNNRLFFYFRELIASVRWINIAIFQCLHLFARFETYNLNLTGQERKVFLRDVGKSLNFYLQGLRNLGKELFNEAESLGLKKQKPKFKSVQSHISIQKKILPLDLDDNIVKKKKERVIEILMKFLEACEKFGVFVCEIASVEQITEEVLEKFRSTFNQIQSLYDSYLKNTDVETKLPELKKIRGHISVTLHLLEIGRALMHFYERHSDKIRKYPSAIKIAQLVNKAGIRMNVKNFVLGNSLTFAMKSKEIGKEIFKAIGTEPDEFILDTNVFIVPAYRIEDFHIRPIMPITQIANKYRIDSFLYFNRKKYNLKSAIEMAIAIPDVREMLVEENTRIMIQGPRKCVKEMKSFLKEKCGAYQKKIVCKVVKVSSSADIDMD